MEGGPLAHEHVIFLDQHAKEEQGSEQGQESETNQDPLFGMALCLVAPGGKIEVSISRNMNVRTVYVETLCRYESGFHFHPIGGFAFDAGIDKLVFHGSTFMGEFRTDFLKKLRMGSPGMPAFVKDEGTEGHRFFGQDQGFFQLKYRLIV